MTVKLYHCKDARSVRPLWTLEEMGIPYELETMRFPPRVFREGYLNINPLGTVPAFTDGDVTMTESAGICQYLVDRYGPTDLGLSPTDKDYGAYLNWLHRSDATLTFPQTIVLRYTRLEPAPQTGRRRLHAMVFRPPAQRRAGNGQPRLSLCGPLHHRRYSRRLCAPPCGDSRPAFRLQAKHGSLLPAFDRTHGVSARAESVGHRCVGK